MNDEKKEKKERYKNIIQFKLNKKRGNCKDINNNNM